MKESSATVMESTLLLKRGASVNSGGFDCGGDIQTIWLGRFGFLHGPPAFGLLAVLLVAGRRRSGVLLRPGVMDAGHGQSRKLVEGYRDGAGIDFGNFFEGLRQAARLVGSAVPLLRGQQDVEATLQVTVQPQLQSVALSLR